MNLIYEGKAKRVYSSQKPDLVEIEFKNSLTAFNAQKKGEFEGKGQVNLEISELIFQVLEQNHVSTHFVEKISENKILAKKVEIIPLEVVVRNTIAGSLAKKLNIEEGKKLEIPVVEFYYKSDELGDPFLNDDQIIALGYSNAKTLLELKNNALRINGILLSLFEQVELQLVDFKVEFGISFTGDIILADEISPDCCRLWDKKTGEKLDKDRFRRDLGNIKESYEEVLRRLKGVLHGKDSDGKSRG